jgi:hypothetical protein
MKKMDGILDSWKAISLKKNITALHEKMDGILDSWKAISLKKTRHSAS